MSISFQGYYGKQYDEIGGAFPQPLTDEFTFNTPVGTVVDSEKRIWVADTGNNRIVLFDKKFTKIIKVIGSETIDSLNMPFRMVHHPKKPWIYVSDVGKDRVLVIEYDENLDVKIAFEFEGNIRAPNGLAISKTKGEVTVFVAEEFYPGPDNMSRILKYSEDGKLTGTIDEVSTSSGEPLKFLWPQGIDTDDKGRLYVANTGFAQIVRCDADGKGIDFKETGKAYLGDFVIPRDVSVIGKTIYVCDSSTSVITMVNFDGKDINQIHGYLSSIQVTKHPEKNKLIITNPITPDVVVAEIPKPQEGDYDFNLPVYSAGGPRDKSGQFHFASSLVQTIPESIDPFDPKHLRKLNPFRFMFNPVGYTIALSSEMSRWFSLMSSGFFGWGNNDKIPADYKWITNPGNYQMVRWDENDGKVSDPKDMLFPPLIGGLGVTAYRPKTLLPGQLVPGTPLFFITDYYSGTVNIYQFSLLLDSLILYSFFSMLGDETFAMTNPLGIAIDHHTDEIYVADSHNNRISKWHFTPFGFAIAIKTFGEEGTEDGQFKNPTDVALDDQGNVYVTDQYNNRIQVFTPEGKFLRKFGTAGYGKDGDKFLLPTSIDFADGHLFVNDLVNRAIKIFTPKGEFVDSFQEFSGKPDSGGMWMPFFLSAHNGEVSVPDCTFNRVNVYKYELADKSGVTMEGEDEKQYTPIAMERLQKTHRRHVKKKVLEDPQYRDHCKKIEDIKGRMRQLKPDDAELSEKHKELHETLQKMAPRLPMAPM